MEHVDMVRGKGHGLRIFLLEIVTITIGLFIALGLNDLVDWQAHRSLVRTAEASLHGEIKSNSRTVSEIRKQIAVEQQQLDGDLAVLRTQAADAKAPHGKLGVEFRISGFNDTAWKTAQAAGAFAYMPYKDVEEFSTLYDTQDAVYHAQQQVANDLLSAAAIAITKPDGASLSPGEIDETTLRIGEAKMRLIFLKALVNSLDKNYQAYLSRHP